MVMFSIGGGGVADSIEKKIFFLSDRASCSPGWPQTYYVVKDDLGLLILLSSGIVSMPYHVWFMGCWVSNSGPCEC